MFSVIIPVHNTARYLRACLDSLSAQTFQDWEAVCVDDGSTDESGAILDGYAVKDGRFRVIHQSNGGEGAARNAGLEAARGTWICFVDSDDILHCRMLETYRRLSEVHAEADMVSIAGVKFKDGEKLSWPAGDGRNVRVLDTGRTVSLEVVQIGVWAFACRRERLLGMRFSALKVGADRVFVCALSERVRCVALSDFVGYGYRQRADSMYHTRYTSKMFLDHLRHYCLLIDCLGRSKKSCEQGIFRKIGLEMTEYLAFDYKRLSAENRRLVWSEWMAALRRIGGCAQVSFCVRLVAWTVGKTGSRMLMWILCWGVGWLKLHGVNRRLSVHRLEDVG